MSQFLGRRKVSKGPKNFNPLKCVKWLKYLKILKTRKKRTKVRLCQVWILRSVSEASLFWRHKLLWSIFESRITLLTPCYQRLVLFRHSLDQRLVPFICPYFLVHCIWILLMPTNLHWFCKNMKTWDNSSTLADQFHQREVTLTRFFSHVSFHAKFGNMRCCDFSVNNPKNSCLVT